MTLKQISQIPMKEKKFLISEICLMYRKLKTSEIKVKKDELQDVKKQINILNNKTVSMFETILSLLPAEQAEIIEIEFVNGVKRNWDDSRWSKTTYYRIKHDAIDQFLFLLYS